jgi:hypothetical protein
MMKTTKKKTKTVSMVRQGDVLLMRLDHDPATKRYTEVPRERDGALVLQHGEVTGHRHRIDDPWVCLLRSDVASEPIILRVLGDAGVSLLHEEHATIHVPKGTYGVVIQEEWEEGAWQQVMD